LEQEITRLQRDARCVRRAAWLMAVLMALALTGIAYARILLENYAYNVQQLVPSLLYALGGGSLISFLAFAGLGMVYRRKLDLRREECRQTVARLLESRLGNPVATSCREPPLSNESSGIVQAPAEGDDASTVMRSATQD
jgi:hypothetical protein